MKKLLISFLVFSSLFVFGSVVFATEDLVPVGSEVVIVRDDRNLLKDQLTTGKKGKIIRYELVLWTLVNENCLLEEKRVKILPDGYKEWKAIEGEEWPGGKTGIPFSTPVIQLEGGSTIKGSQCYWDLVDKKKNENFVKVLMKRIAEWADFMQKKGDEFKQKQQKP